MYYSGTLHVLRIIKSAERQQKSVFIPSALAVVFTVGLLFNHQDGACHLFEKTSLVTA
jgi:hypothetical protein